MDRQPAARSKGAVKTFIIDWPILVFIGLLFGALAPVASPWASRAFVAGVIAAIAFSATAFISYAVAPDWMWMYFTDPDAVAWTLPAIAIGYLATFGLGYAAAVGLRSLGGGYVVAFAATAIVAELVIVAATWDRYRLVGTRREWLGGSAHPLIGVSPEGPAQVIAPMGPLFAVVLAAALYWTWRGRRATTSDR